MLLILTILSALLGSVAAVAPVQGTKCAPNQVINRLTVFDDGALEVECGPIPCGQSGMVCKEDATCRAESDVAHGLRWAANGKSLLLRCCSLKTSNKIYVGTDVVTFGSYYQGGIVKEEFYGKNGAPEYDFIANLRAEQGGIRVWVYRIMCEVGETPVPLPTEAPTTPIPTSPRTTTEADVEIEESNDDENEEVEVSEQEDEAPQEEEKPFNPLRYRPPSSLQRASTGVHRH